MPTKKLKVTSEKSKIQNKTKKLEKTIAADVFDTKGKIIGKAILPKELFGAKVNPQLMAQAVCVYLANQRKGTASTKTRGEVHASTRKIYRQKGTGRARHGAISAPIFVGGGVAFGPRPKDFSLTMPKKMKKLALASALTSKLQEKTMKVVDGLEKLAPKTKAMVGAMRNILATDKKKEQKILLVTNGKTKQVQRSARNIRGVTIRPMTLLNTYEVLNSDIILFMKSVFSNT